MRKAASIFPSDKRLRRVLSAQVHQRRRAAGLDAVGFQQDQGQHLRPAPFPSDRDPFPGQPGNPVDGRRAAVKDRERLVEDGPEGNQLLQRNPLGHPALHESHVDANRGIVQLLEVVQRPFRRQDPQLHAVPRQDLPVPLGRPLEDAAGRAADDRDGVGRRGPHIPIGRRDRRRRDQDQGTGRHREIAEGDPGEPAHPARARFSVEGSVAVSGHGSHYTFRMKKAGSPGLSPSRSRVRGGDTYFISSHFPRLRFPSPSSYISLRPR